MDNYNYYLFSYVFLVIVSLVCLVDAQGNANTRVVVAVAGLNDSTVISFNEDNKPLFQLRTQDVTYYLRTTVGAHSYTFQEKAAGGGNVVIVASVNNTQLLNQSYTIVLASQQGEKKDASMYQALTYEDDWNIAEGTAKIRFIHLAPLTGDLIVLGNSTKSQPLSYTQTSGFIVYPSNLQYAFYIVHADSGAVVANEFLFLNDETSYTVFIQGLPSTEFVTLTQDYPADEP